MTTLTHIERQKLERELGMSSGSVLSFSNRSFEEFFREVVGVEIYQPKYNLGSGSKANRMRAFWQTATQSELRLLIQGLLDAWDVYENRQIPPSARELLLSIVARLGEVPTIGVRRGSPPHEAIDAEAASRLHTELLNLSMLAPGPRGYALERFLVRLFEAYGLSPRPSFRLIGEQIDGSFVLNNDTYLIEAKWQSAPTGSADLHVLEGKLNEKAAWSRGLFVSNSGFSPDGLSAFGRGKRLVCMDGLDLSEMLTARRSIVEVLNAKIRRAAETGIPFVSVRDLFP